MGKDHLLVAVLLALVALAIYQSYSLNSVSGFVTYMVR